MICAIVLAAGRSRRMGTQKLLLPFAGSTVIAQSPTTSGSDERSDAMTGVPHDMASRQGRPNPS